MPRSLTTSARSYPQTLLRLPDMLVIEWIAKQYKIMVHRIDHKKLANDKTRIWSSRFSRDKQKLLLYRRHRLNKIGFAKCLAEEGSVYTQRAMVSASLLDNTDLFGPYRAGVVTCKPYNQRTEQILYFVDHFNEQLKTDIIKIARSVHSLTANKGSSKTNDMLRMLPLLLRSVTNNFYVVKCSRFGINDKQLALIHRI